MLVGPDTRSRNDKGIRKTSSPSRRRLLQARKNSYSRKRPYGGFEITTFHWGAPSSGGDNNGACDRDRKSPCNILTWSVEHPISLATLRRAPPTIAGSMSIPRRR